MAVQYHKITNLFFEPQGVHDPQEAYSIMDVVTSEDGSTAYAALQDVPAGTSLDDTSYWRKVIDVSETKKAMDDSLTLFAPNAKNIGLRVKGEVVKASGNPVTFLPDADSLIVPVTTFEPVQSGEGDASRDNVRSIAGWSALNLVHQEDARSVEFGETVYGGSMDWLTGELTKGWHLETFTGASGEAWNKPSTQPVTGWYRYDRTVTNSKTATGNECLCSHSTYWGVNNKGDDGNVVAKDGVWVTSANSSNETTLSVRFVTPFATSAEWKDYLAEQYANGTPVQVAYRVRTPDTAQYAPNIIVAPDAEQENTVSGDGSIEVQYVEPLVATIEKHTAPLIARLDALEAAAAAQPVSDATV